MFPCLSPWTASPNKLSANQSAVFEQPVLKFNTLRGALINGLDGHMPPVNKQSEYYHVDWTLSPLLN